MRWQGHRSWGIEGDLTPWKYDMSHSFTQNCCWMTASFTSSTMKDLSKMEGKTVFFSRRLKQFDWPDWTWPPNITTEYYTTVRWNVWSAVGASTIAVSRWWKAPRLGSTTRKKAYGYTAPRYRYLAARDRPRCRPPDSHPPPLAPSPPSVRPSTTRVQSSSARGKPRSPTSRYISSLMTDVDFTHGCAFGSNS